MNQVFLYPNEEKCCRLFIVYEYYIKVNKLLLLYKKKKVVYIILCELLAALWIFKNLFVLNCVQEGLEYVAMMLESLYCKYAVFVYIKKTKLV